MSDHPSTFEAEDTHRPGIEWEDRASIHRQDDGQGLFDGAKGLHRGSFAEMITLILQMPEGTRQDFVIQKAGDRAYSVDEAKALAEHPDFPKQ